MEHLDGQERKVILILEGNVVVKVMLVIKVIEAYLAHLVHVVLMEKSVNQDSLESLVKIPLLIGNCKKTLK